MTNEDKSERTELAWIEVLTEQRQAILDEAKAKAKLLKAEINCIAKYALDTITGEDQRYLASLLYWEYKDIVNANMIAKGVGLKHGNVLKGWVYPAVFKCKCELCDKIFEYKIPGRSHFSPNMSLPRYCDACWDRMLNEHQQEKEKQQASLLTVEELKSMPYADYLQTKHWQGKRKGALKRSKYRCQVCNTNGRTLHTHHRTYENRGEERAADLIVLCEECHATFHESGKLAK